MESVSVQEETFTHNSNNYRAILYGGLLAGSLDLTAAFINSGLQGVDPARVLRAIAGGVLGAESSKDGFVSAALGFMLHFAIAFGATTFFYAASRKIKFLIDHYVISGILYGIAVYLFMNFLVVPLSAFPFPMPITLRTITTNALIHIFCVGLPISMCVRRFAKW